WRQRRPPVFLGPRPTVAPVINVGPITGALYGTIGKGRTKGREGRDKGTDGRRDKVKRSRHSCISLRPFVPFPHHYFPGFRSLAPLGIDNLSPACTSAFLAASRFSSMAYLAG